MHDGRPGLARLERARFPSRASHRARAGVSASRNARPSNVPHDHPSPADFDLPGWMFPIILGAIVLTAIRHISCGVVACFAMMLAVSQARSSWESLDPAWRDAYAEAWASWSAGCFGIGCVMVDGQGTIVARGRNRVLEPATAPGALADTLIAHAEMNALADFDLDRGTGEALTLYTPVEPCLMCASAILMVRIGRVRFAVADPMFEGLQQTLGDHPYCAERMPHRDGPLNGPMAVFAGLLPLMFNMTWTPRGRWMRLHESLFPDQHRLASNLIASRRLVSIAADAGVVTDALEEIWDDLVSLSS